MDNQRYIEEIDALKKTIKTINKEHRTVINSQIKDKENQIQKLQNEVELLKMKYNEELDNESDGGKQQTHFPLIFENECCHIDSHDIICLGVAKYYLGKEI